MKKEDFYAKTREILTAPVGSALFVYDKNGEVYGILLKIPSGECGGAKFSNILVWPNYHFSGRFREVNDYSFKWNQPIPQATKFETVATVNESTGKYIDYEGSYSSPFADADEKDPLSIEASDIKRDIISSIGDKLEAMSNDEISAKAGSALEMTEEHEEKSKEVAELAYEKGNALSPQISEEYYVKTFVESAMCDGYEIVSIEILLRYMTDKEALISEFIERFIQEYGAKYVLNRRINALEQQEYDALLRDAKVTNAKLYAAHCISTAIKENTPDVKSVRIYIGDLAVNVPINVIGRGYNGTFSLNMLTASVRDSILHSQASAAYIEESNKFSMEGIDKVTYKNLVLYEKEK